MNGSDTHCAKLTRCIGVDRLTGNTNSRVDLPVRWINYLTSDAIIRLLLNITLALRLRRPLMCRKSFLQYGGCLSALIDSSNRHPAT